MQQFFYKYKDVTRQIDSTVIEIRFVAWLKEAPKKRRPPLTDDIQLEEVLQVRVRQGWILAAALEDLAMIVGDG